MYYSTGLLKRSHLGYAARCSKKPRREVHEPPEQIGDLEDDTWADDLANASKRDGLDHKPAWMTKGMGINEEIFGKTTGDLMKPGLTKADLERLERAVPQGPDPFGDVFKEAFTEKRKASDAQALLPRKLFATYSPAGKLDVAFSTASENSKASASTADPKKDSLTVYVGGISYSVEKEQFELDMTDCGEVRSLQWLVDENGNPKGSAFVTFMTQDGVSAALKLHGDEYWGRKLRIDRAVQRIKVNDLEVFVKGFPNTCSEDRIRRHFAHCGEISQVRMPADDEGNPKGIALITFQTKEGHESALLLDGKDFEGGTALAVRESVHKAGNRKDRRHEGKGKGKGKDKCKGKKKR